MQAQICSIAAFIPHRHQPSKDDLTSSQRCTADCGKADQWSRNQSVVRQVQNSNWQLSLGALITSFELQGTAESKDGCSCFVPVCWCLATFAGALQSNMLTGVLQAVR